MMLAMALAPTDLPIEDCIDSLRHALATAKQAVLSAEPGAGKTTIVPLRLLDEPWLAGQTIVLLEPRRIAARAAARRMAHLLGEPPGQTVGWITRDSRLIGPDTRIQVVTEGILTNRLVSEPTLPGTGLVIFDEFHERSLPGDTGLALALHARAAGLLSARLLVMSATIDTEAVAAVMGGAPIIESRGRTYPIEIVWRPRKRRDPLAPAVVQAVKEALRGPGDVLVFLPGAGEIRRVERELYEEFGRDRPTILQLHGSLPPADQDAALVSRDSQRVVLATDIAETSLTVDGITTVVDAGLARVPRHDPRTSMTALLTIANSKASATQRAGRAGRLGPGVAIRMWSKIEHGSRPVHLPPAITQVEVAGLALDLARRGITDPSEVPFLDPPPVAAWNDARVLLRRLGALDEQGAATELGRSMAKLGTHPRLARGIASGRHRWLCCVLAALLDDRDVLRGRPGSIEAGLAARVSLVAVYGTNHVQSDPRATRSVRDQAHLLARKAGIKPHNIKLADIGAALAAGFPDRIARRKTGTRDRFVTADGRTLKLNRDDPLAAVPGIVAVDLGGRPKEPIVWRGAPYHAQLDHLVYATPNLDATVAEIGETWGIEPAAGGRHDGRGTRNALLGIGNGAYLEIIGPDPSQPNPPEPRPFGIDNVTDPTLVTWAAAVPDLDLWLEWCAARKVNPGPGIAMQRSKPDGEVLHWRLTMPPPDGDGVIPFLIEWPGPTPAQSAPSGAQLVEFRLGHPDGSVRARMMEYGLDNEVGTGAPQLSATFLTPLGVVNLRREP